MAQSDCLALHNFLAYRSRSTTQADDLPKRDKDLLTAVVDFGADTTSVVVSGPGAIWMRSTGFGAQSFNKALVRELKLTAAQAEAHKRAPSKAESPSRFHHAIEPVFEDLAAEIRASVEAFSRSRECRQVGLILGIGGGFATHGVLRYLRAGA